MRIAITAASNEIDSEMDPRFGRAPYILIVDDEGTVIEVVDNAKNVNAMKGAGIQTAKMMADRKVDVLMTGHCGPNAFTALKAAGIRVVTEQSGSVLETLGRLKRNEVRFAEEPNVEAHW